MSSYAGSAHTTALLAAIQAVWARTGDATVPTDKTLPYAVVYPLGSATFDGSISDPQGDAWPVTQVTCIGSTREQAETLRDRIRAGVVGAWLTVNGRAVGPVRLDVELPVQRDDDVTPHLFYAVDHLRLYSTPA